MRAIVVDKKGLGKETGEKVALASLSGLQVPSVGRQSATGGHGEQTASSLQRHSHRLVPPTPSLSVAQDSGVCVCVCVCARARACVFVFVCVNGWV